MSERVTKEELMRYLDGETSPEERREIEAAAEASTELRREVAAYRALKENLTSLQFSPSTGRDSVWDRVNKRLARPAGWLLLVIGVVVWIAYGTYIFVTSSTAILEKLATGAIVVGTLVLLTSVIWERYREHLTDPYRDIQR